MVGAQADDFKKVEPILSKMGKNIVHAGSNGSGLIAKICNNLLLGIRYANAYFKVCFICLLFSSFSMIGTSEAMNLGIKLVFFIGKRLRIFIL